MKNDLSDFISLAENKKIAWNKDLLKFIYFPTIDSTNCYAAELAAKQENLKDNYLILADTQQKGKGQKENTWFSPPGVNIYFSLLLNPEIPAKDMLTIPETWGEMVKKTVEKISGLKAQIKKPNDVLINQKKIAGILLESRIQGEVCKTIIAGVGVNINTEYHQFPKDLKSAATSLLIETGRKYSRSDFLINFFQLNDDFNI